MKHFTFGTRAALVALNALSVVVIAWLWWRPGTWPLLVLAAVPLVGLVLAALRPTEVGLRPAGTPTEVEALRVAWQRLHDLAPGGPDACGHDYECDEYLDRNDAVHEARALVSWRQERRVFRSLVRHAPAEGLPLLVWDVVAAVALAGLVARGGPAGLVVAAAGALLYLRARRSDLGDTRGSDAQELPGLVGFAEHRSELDAAPSLAPLVGVAAGGRLVGVPMGAEASHVLVAVGAGGGSSSLVRVLVAQMAHHGVPVAVIDPRRSQRWAAGLATVTHWTTPADIQEGLLALGGEATPRRVDAATPGTTSLLATRQVVVVCDATTTLQTLGRYWRQARTEDSPHSSPARAALSRLLTAGRAAGVVVVVEDATGLAFGPVERAQFATVLVGRYYPDRFARIAPEITPVPPPSRRPGRLQVIRDIQAIEIQALLATAREARDWATSRPAVDVDVDPGVGS